MKQAGSATHYYYYLYIYRSRMSKVGSVEWNHTGDIKRGAAIISVLQIAENIEGILTQGQF
jgi:hypothetical protein